MVALIFALLVFAFLAFLIIRALFKGDLETALHCVLIVAPITITVGCLWFLGSGYPFLATAITFTSAGIWIGYKLVFWRFFGRTMTEEESHKARNWLLFKK